MSMLRKVGIMTNTADQTSTSTNTPKGSPVTVKTFEDVLKLHGVERLEVDPWVQDLAINSTNKLLQEYGPEWISQNRVRLIEELELIDSF